MSHPKRSVLIMQQYCGRTIFERFWVVSFGPNSHPIQESMRIYFKLTVKFLVVLPILKLAMQRRREGLYIFD